MSKMLAVHFLRADMRSANGDEKPWKVGETRAIKGKLELCARGYHYSPTWAAALLGEYLYGPIACVVWVESDGPHDEHKGVSRMRTLIKAVDVTREMRLFAADEAARAQRLVERRTGKKADPRSWAAAWDAAGAAAWDAGWAASAKRFAARIGDAVGYWDKPGAAWQ